VLIPRTSPRDRGLSTVELVVSMIVTGVLIAVVTPVLVSVMRSYTKVQDTSLAADRGRVVLDRIDRDLRQVAAINRPTTQGQRVYVEYEIEALAPGSTATCTQWRYNRSTGRLDVRTWASGTSGAPGWSTATSAVVNDPAAEPPFVMTPADGTTLHQQLTVQLRLRLPQGQALTRTVLTARNSSAGSTSNADADGDGASDTPVCTGHGRT
jgi:Tfp pilus assembly protein PilW